MPASILAVILFLSSMVLMITIGGILQGTHPQYGLIASELLCILLPALVAAHLMRRDAHLPTPTRFGVPRRFTVVLWVIATSALLGFAANAVTGILAELSPALKEVAVMYEQMFQGLMFPDEPLHRAAAIAAICIFAPLCEETLFRGVVLPLHLDDRIGRAILLNGLMFSLLHLNPLSFAALIIVGAFFAHLALLTRSLWAPILAHATLNFANGVLGPMLADTSTAVAEPALSDYALAAGLLAPIVAAMWFFGARKLFKQSGSTDA